MGNALKDQGRLDEARAAYHKALELKPDYIKACLNLGVALLVQGRLDEAVASLRQAKAIDPDYVEAYYNLALSQRGEIDNGSMRHLEAILARNRLSADEKLKLHFTLAKAFEEKGDADAAFAHYRRGNEVRRVAFAGDGVRFDAEAQDRLVACTGAVFTDQFFASHQSFGIASEAPVFVVGMPRSGTTLVEQIAASHPRVHGAGERWEMMVASHNLADALGTQAPYPESAAELDSGTAARLGEAYLGRLREVAGDAERVIDKLPFNYLLLGLIAVLLPRARVIHCRREARDLCLSCYFENFANPFPWPTDLYDIGRYHRAYERMMAHWRSVLPRAMLEVDYEDLVADQEGQSRRIIDFLGLRWDPRCLDFHRTQRQVNTASSWQVRRPIYATSVGRWRAYERMLEPLEAGLAGEDGGETK